MLSLNQENVPPNESGTDFVNTWWLCLNHRPRRWTKRLDDAGKDKRRSTEAGEPGDSRERSDGFVQVTWFLQLHQHTHNLISELINSSISEFIHLLDQIQDNLSISQSLTCSFIHWKAEIIWIVFYKLDTNEYLIVLSSFFSLFMSLIHLNGSKLTHLQNMFCSFLMQTTFGICNKSSISFLSNQFTDLHWHLIVISQKRRIQSRIHQIYLKFNIVLKSYASAIKILGNFVSKYLCSPHAAHRGGSHVVLKPEETSAQRASNVLCQMQTWFRIDARHVGVLQWVIFSTVYHEIKYKTEALLRMKNFSSNSLKGFVCLNSFWKTVGSL